ncbi:MAG: AMP-binding protein [Thermoanaerobaculia bacterium]
MTLRTMGDLVLELARREKPEQLLHKVDGGWQATSSTDLVAKVGRLARGLGQLGVAKGDRVGLIATNGPLWVAIDLATLLSGGAMVAVDGAFTPGQSAAILNDSRVRFLFVEGSEQLAKVLALRSDVPTLEAIVAFGGAEPAGGALELESLLAEQPDCAYADLEGMARNLEPADLATIVYTSGTTSRPKGVMVSHRNLAFVIEGAVRAMPLEPSWTALSMLSLCYLFERVEDYAYLHAGPQTIAYAESLDRIANACEVKPHVFVTVPRILERVVSAVEEQVRRRAPGGSRGAGCGPSAWPRYRARSLPVARRAGLPRGAGRAARVAGVCRAGKGLQRLLGGRPEFCMAGELRRPRGWRGSSGAPVLLLTRAMASQQKRRPPRP